MDIIFDNDPYFELLLISAEIDFGTQIISIFPHSFGGFRIENEIVFHLIEFVKNEVRFAVIKVCIGSKYGEVHRGGEFQRFQIIKPEPDFDIAFPGGGNQ